MPGLWIVSLPHGPSARRGQRVPVAELTRCVTRSDQSGRPLPRQPLLHVDRRLFAEKGGLVEGSSRAESVDDNVFMARLIGTTVADKLETINRFPHRGYRQ